MSSFAKNNPNKIKQSSQCCMHCGKSYVKKENMDKHILICGLLHQSKKSLIVEDDMTLPSQKQLYQMLIELADKYNKLEAKIDEISKCVVKKRPKINVLEWLNANINPPVTYDIIINQITILDSDMQYIMTNSFYDTFNEILTRTICNIDETENPIFAFAKKPNVFYIYDVDKIWVEMSKDKLIKMFNKIHSKIVKAFTDWREVKTHNVTNDSLLMKYDEIQLKIMKVECAEAKILSKLTHLMFAKMKTAIEYEIEF